MDKAEGAFLTIGELARELGVAQHILRYWETRFTQLRPLQRSGNRRYYRPADVAVARRIDQLLNKQGFTVRGAKRVLDGAGEAHGHVADMSPAPAPRSAPQSVRPAVAPAPASPTLAQSELSLGTQPPSPRAAGPFESSDVALLIARLTVIRDNLRDAVGID